MRIPNRIKECKIMGVDIACTSMNHLLRTIKDRLPELSGNYICATNVHAIVTAYRNESYRKVQNDAFMRLPDGAPVAMVAGTRSETRAEKISGPDVMTEIFKVSASYGYKHYFYGSTEETLKKLEDTLYKKYPGINIVGMKSPPFRPLTKEEDAEVIRDINHAKPDFIWVGLGAPKQEIWMYEHQEKVNGLMIGVGAGFDFHAGTVKRAPVWMQKCGLEWFYRLTQEPKRLFRRYLSTNACFVWNAIIKGR